MILIAMIQNDNAVDNDDPHHVIPINLSMKFPRKWTLQTKVMRIIIKIVIVIIREFISIRYKRTMEHFFTWHVDEISMLKLSIY